MSQTDINSKDFIEFMRNRPAMYIGDTKTKGFLNLINNILTDSTSINQKLIDVEIKAFKENKFRIEITNCDLNLFLKENYYKYTNLNLIIALSQQIKVLIFKKDKTIEINGVQGKYKTQITLENNDQEKLILDFQLDLEIFKDFQHDYRDLNDFLRKFAFLYPEFKINYQDFTNSKVFKSHFSFPNGTLHQLEFINPDFENYSFEIKTKKYLYQLSFSFKGKNHIETYANSILLIGGSLIKGTLAGILKSIKKYAKTKNLKIFLNSSILKDNICLIASVRSDVQDFQFDNNSHTRISSPSVSEIKELIFNEFYDYLSENKERADRIVECFS